MPDKVTPEKILRWLDNKLDPLSDMDVDSWAILIAMRALMVKVVEWKEKEGGGERE